MHLETKGVEFCFDNTMYGQIDWVSMNNPLSQILSESFVVFYEQLFFLIKCHKPHVYLRYVDDTFSISDSINDAAAFHVQLNSLHPFLHFTMKVENDCTLPFFDVFVEYRDYFFLNCVHCKPTFTDIYNNWNSFVPKPRTIKRIS